MVSRNLAEQDVKVGKATREHSDATQAVAAHVDRAAAGGKTTVESHRDLKLRVDDTEFALKLAAAIRKT
jgi:hypothetical protein